MTSYADISEGYLLLCLTLSRIDETFKYFNPETDKLLNDENHPPPIHGHKPFDPWSLREAEIWLKGQFMMAKEPEQEEAGNRSPICLPESPRSSISFLKKLRGDSDEEDSSCSVGRVPQIRYRASIQVEALDSTGVDWSEGTYWTGDRKVADKLTRWMIASCYARRNLIIGGVRDIKPTIAQFICGGITAGELGFTLLICASAAVSMWASSIKEVLGSMTVAVIPVIGNHKQREDIMNSGFRMEMPCVFVYSLELFRNDGARYWALPDTIQRDRHLKNLPRETKTSSNGKEIRPEWDLVVVDDALKSSKPSSPLYPIMTTLRARIRIGILQSSINVPNMALWHLLNSQGIAHIKDSATFSSSVVDMIKRGGAKKATAVEVEARTKALRWLHFVLHKRVVMLDGLKIVIDPKSM